MKEKKVVVEEKKMVKKYLSYFPAEGSDVITTDEDVHIITLKRKNGNCTDVYAIGNLVNGLVGCGLKLKRVRARLVSIELEQNPGNISAEDARMALGDGIEGFRKGYVELYGEVLLWRPAWKFEYEVEVKNE